MSVYEPSSWVCINFEVGGHVADVLQRDDRVGGLVEALKNGYVAGNVATDLFEEQVDAIFRYQHRLDWTTYGARLELRGDELRDYPAIVTWVS